MSMSLNISPEKRALADVPTERVPAVRPPTVARLLCWPAWVDDRAVTLAGREDVNSYLMRLVLRDEYERGETW